MDRIQGLTTTPLPFTNPNIFFFSFFFVCVALFGFSHLPVYMKIREIFDNKNKALKLIEGQVIHLRDVFCII